MKTCLIFFSLILFIYNQAFGQSVISEKYFKDEQKTKEVKLEKAKFKEIISQENDSTIKEELIEISNNKTVYLKYFKNDFPVKSWQYFNKKGELSFEIDCNKINYSDEKVASGNYFNLLESDNDSLDFIPAKFIHQDDFITFIRRNIIYPRHAIENNIHGTVLVHIKIDTEGKANFISIYRSAHPLLDLETIRFINTLPNWKPATKNGQPIDSYTIFPIKFQLI